MSLECQQQCLICLEQVVQARGGKESFGALSSSLVIENFQQLCNYLKIEFPQSSLKFKNVSKMLNIDKKNGCESLLCGKCFEMVNGLGMMYSELRKTERRIDDGIKGIQEVVRRSEQHKADSGNDGVTTNDKPTKKDGVNGGGNLKRAKIDGNSATASSSVVRDYFEFVDTFRKLVKEVVTKEPEPMLLSEEADKLVNEQFEDDDDELDVKEEDVQQGKDSIAVLSKCRQNGSGEEQSAAYYIDDLSREAYSTNFDDAVYNTLSNVDLSMETDKDSGENSMDSGDFIMEEEPNSESPMGYASDSEVEVECGPIPSTNSRDPLDVTTNSSLTTTATSSASFSAKQTRASCYYTCRYCQGTFENAFAYYNHRKEKHPEESKALKIPALRSSDRAGSLTRVCPECGDGKISNKNSFLKFMEHMLSHEVMVNSITTVPGDISFPDEDKPYACDHCEQRFLLEMNLDLHKICYHESTLVQLKCEECGDTTSKSWEDLVNHLVVVHSSQTIYSCKSCQMAFRTPDRMLEHMQVHTMSKRLPCPECSSVAPTLKNLYQHFNEAHPNLLTPLQCESCQEVFLMPSTYRRHMTTAHTPAATTFTKTPTSSSVAYIDSSQNVQCPHCLDVRIFKNRITLDNHIKIHHDITVEKHPCHICKKYFVHKSTLKYHIQQVHLGIRYGCPHCPKSFTAKSLLKGHLKLHNGEGPPVLRCSVCQKAYKSSAGLKAHMVTKHQPSNPVNCDICGRKFSNMYSLRGHKSEVHNLKPFPCPHCPVEYARLKQFQKHLSTHGDTDVNISEPDELPLKIVAVKSMHELLK